MDTLFREMPPPRSILVICTGRIGDVLLGTPVVRSLKAHWPDAQIDMLVFDGTGGVLENNPDLRGVVCIAQRARQVERFAEALKLWRRYDLVCSLRTSSLASFLCWMAGSKRIGIVAPARKTWIKRLMLNRFVVDRDDSLHVVQSGLSLMSLLGITPCFNIVPPAMPDRPKQLAQLNLLLESAAGQPYVVVHVYPRYAYKMWHAEGWVALVEFLRARGYAIVLTGGPAEEEVAYACDIRERAGVDIVNLVGKLSLAATTEVIRRARLFVGPDTSATHIAAATGTPTLALFGPSNPVRWGPWPKGWTDSSPWPISGSGRRGNVYLLQGAGACVPCKLEGCDAHIHSRSDCLLTLDADRVIDATTELLGIAPDQKRRIPIVAQSFAGAPPVMAKVNDRPAPIES
ncbi:lipopolysaccharide heptosyltransferase III [Burkholderia sp. H160]|nr:lipopolysaccharide heptosyltransferase III [Burkholderia sp. H160]